MKTMNRFRWEITVAVIIKFTLFGLVWWFFFAGQKIHVDEQRLANRLLGEPISKEEKFK